MSLPPWPALLLGAPYAVVPGVVAWRLLRARTLPPAPTPAPGEAVPRVSVIIPARNEAKVIERLVRSVLATRWPDLELLVVDDHSSDGTGDLARTAGLGDPRLRVIVPPPLPAGWFGKQWACWCGAQAATGERLLFADADTWHGPDLAGRMVRGQDEAKATLLSVVGTQELGTFWERVTQPIPALLLALRFGGFDGVERATRPTQVIANGQCLIMRRDDYLRLGGHEAVRDNVAEDLRLAQRVQAGGGRVAIRVALDDQRTRMYDSLGSIIAGWGKNIYAGGKHMLPPSLRGAFRAAMFVGPALLLLPTLLIVAGRLGLAPWWALQAGVIGYVAQATWVGILYAALGHPAWPAPFHPLGAAVFWWISIVAGIRGDHVTWRGRTYLSR